MIKELLEHAIEKIRENSGIHIKRADIVNNGDNHFEFRNKENELVGEIFLNYDENQEGFDYSMEVFDFCGDRHYIEEGMFNYYTLKLEIKRTFYESSIDLDTDIEKIEMKFSPDWDEKPISYDKRVVDLGDEEYDHITRLYDYDLGRVTEMDWYGEYLETYALEKYFELNRY